MSTETMSYGHEAEARDAEIYKLRIELDQFVIKMKSEGYLSSVEYKDSVATLDIDQQIDN